MSLGLTSKTGLTLAPLLMKCLATHYFEQCSDEVAPGGEQGGSLPNGNLRHEELLYDQVFTIVKNFMKIAARDHTVEELQAFANIKTPHSIGMRAMEVVVPMSFCDRAAKRLIDALGGEAKTKKIVGGTKWWQIRGIDGVHGEWIVASKDRKEEKRREKAREEKNKGNEKEGFAPRYNTTGPASAEGASESDYTADMDKQRCILYLHGGGYYFGSVDQVRYSVQRFARKINARALAINYRLSPQYPFPCAIQDALAAYLYLIEPRGELEEHKPVKPQHIVIMGDSAGGGLALALLQVIRDSGLPQCAGGVLISPWCDLNHSFDSIHKNTETDIIPYYGLSMHKPSALWPPPSNDELHEVRKGIRNHLQSITGASAGRQVDFGAPKQAPNIILTVKGKTRVVDSQIQFYAPNDLLSHPLISHCRAYLGGLPPLFFMAGDQEVLRDEIIYTAHRAANPSGFSISDESKRLYPKIAEAMEKYTTPANVHLQVYDGCAHDLPILFAFTTPAKYCFRAIAGFCRFTTGMPPFSPGSPSPKGPGSLLFKSFSRGRFFEALRREARDSSTENMRGKSSRERDPMGASRVEKKPEKERQRHDEKSRGESAKRNSKGREKEGRHAGDYPPSYEDLLRGTNFVRERVSIQGLIRPLEPKAELPAMQLNEGLVGAVREKPFTRYIEGKEEYSLLYPGTPPESVEKERQASLELAFKDSSKLRSRFERYFGNRHVQNVTVDNYNWSWALDKDENPPPSSIVSRRDTPEAVKLAEVIDCSVENMIRGRY